MRTRESRGPQRQSQTISSRFAAASNATNRLSRVAGAREIDEPDRTFMERRFGADFSSVRIHADAMAPAARGARACTLDRHIVLDAREYRPGTAPYRQLLAHELAHVLQGPLAVPPASGVLGGSSAGTPPANREGLEREADAAAALVMRGGDARVRGVAPPGALLAKAPDAGAEGGAEGLVAAYQQAGPTCGAASLVSALLIWERQRPQPGPGRSMTASACDLILAQLHQRRPDVEAAIARSSASEGEPAALYDWVVKGVESAREAASRPGGLVSEAQYQHLGLALYLMWTDKSDKLGDFQRMLGLETTTMSSVANYDNLWNSAVLAALEPGQIAQVDWYVRSGPDVGDPNGRLGDHAFLIGRLASGEWFLSDQAAGPSGRFSAATREDLRDQVDRAAWSNEYWIYPASPPIVRAKSVRLLATPEQARSAGAESLLPNKSIGEVDAGISVGGEVVTAGPFVTSGSDRTVVAQALPAGGSGLLIEAAPGTFFLYSATAVATENLSATALDTRGVLATGISASPPLEHDFVNAWLILGDARGKRGNTIEIP